MSDQVKTVYDGFYKVEKNSDNGHERVRTTDSVAVIVFNRQSGTSIFVRQCRWPMVSDENPEGEITEVVAGRFDYKVGVEQLVVNELREEAGIEITPDQVKILNGGKPLAASPGILTERIFLAYVEVSLDYVHGSFGAEGENEQTETTSEFVGQLDRIIYDDLKTFALGMWLLLKRTQKEHDKFDNREFWEL